MALTNLLTVCKTSGVDSEIRLLLKSAIDFYLKLVARPDVKNDCAEAILYELAGQYVVVMGEDLLRSNNGGGKRQRVDWRYIIIPSMLAPDNGTERSESVFDLFPRDSDAGEVLLSFMTTSRNLLRRQCVDDITARLMTLRSWQDSMQHNNDTSPGLSAPDTLRFAEHVANCQAFDWGCFHRFSEFTWHYVSDSQKHVLQNAIGLIVATETSMRLQENNRLHLLSKEDFLPSIVRSSIKALRPDHGMVALQVVQSAGVIEKLLKSCWTYDLETPIGGPHGVHSGRCRAKNLWKHLDRSIYEFDKKRSWLERQNFLRRRKWPQLKEDPEVDAMSIVTASSENSFTKLHAVALRLYLRGSGSSFGSNTSSNSKFSGHMSVDSWRLQTIDDVDESMEFEPVTNEDRQEQDEVAFRKIMQEVV